MDDVLLFNVGLLTASIGWALGLTVLLDGRESRRIRKSLFALTAVTGLIVVGWLILSWGLTEYYETGTGAATWRVAVTEFLFTVMTVIFGFTALYSIVVFVTRRSRAQRRCARDRGSRPI